MQDEEDLAKFIEEQRAKIAYDRDRLKNNPPSTISENTVNRQILNIDKENRVPFDGKSAQQFAPRQENHEPLPIQTAVRPPSTPRIFRLGDDYKRKQEKLKEELKVDYRNAMAEKNLRTTGRRHPAQADVSYVARTNSDLGLSLPLKDRLSAKGKDAATETYEELLERKRKQEKSYRGIDDDEDDPRERRRYRDEEVDDGYSQRRIRFPPKGKRSHGKGGRSRRDDDFADYDDDGGPPYRSKPRRGRPARRGRRYSEDDSDEYDSEEERVPRRKRNVSFERRQAPAYEREATTGSLHVTKEKPESDDLRSKSAPPEQEYTGLPIGHVPSANTVQRKKEEYRVQLLQQMEENKKQKKKERDLTKELGGTSIYALATNKNTNNAVRTSKDTGKAKRYASPSPPPHDPEPREKKKSKKSKRRVTLELSSDEEDSAPRMGPYRAPVPRMPYFAPPMQPPPMGYYPQQFTNSYNDPYYYYGQTNPLDPAAAMGLPPPGSMYPGVSPVMAAAMATGRAERSDSPDGIRKAAAQPMSTRRSHKNESSLVADEKRDQEWKKQQTLEYQEELKVQIQRKEKEKAAAKAEQERYDLKKEEEARNYDPWGKGGGGAPMKDRQGNLISDLRQMHLENEEAGRDPTKAEEVVRERLPQTNTYRREDRPVIDLSPRNPGPGDDGDINALSPRFGRSNPFEIRQSDEQKAQRDVYKDYLRKQIEEKQRLEAEKRERDRIEEEKEERRLEEQRKKIQAELEAEQEKDRNKKEMARRQNEELRIEVEERKKEEKKRKIEEEEELRKKKERELDEKLRVATHSPVIPTLRKQQQERESPRPLPPPVSEQRQPPFEEERRMNLEQTPRRQPVARTPRIQTYRAESPPRERDRQPAASSRMESKRISRELSALRKQLLSEQRRVEDQLRTVDLSQPQPKINSEFLIDLSRAKQKPVSVRRPPTVDKDRPSSRALRDFSDYKHRPDDTASIRMFRAEYPETPDDSKGLERQQQALLARQGRNLEDLRHQARSGPQEPERRKVDRRRPRALIPPSVAQSRASLLEAETTYIPIVPDDDDEADSRYHFDSNQSSPPQSRQSRRPSARERRRMARKPPSARSDKFVPPRSRPDNFSLNSLSSLATLDVDRLANTNRERLDKLRAIQGDEVSLTDPDDILDRFVNRQKGRRPPSNDDGLGGRAGPSGFVNPEQVAFNTRPPSVNTVDTEPWLRPETGPTMA